MADNKNYTVVANNQHSVSVYELPGMEFKGTFFVTDGQILGQPIISGDTCTINVCENGKNWINVYSFPSLGFQKKIPVS